jgi:Amidases related to nicotinamidase
MKNMLVVVDYQEDFVDGALGFPDAKDLDTGIAALVDEATTAGDTVVYTMDSHGGDYLDTREGKVLPVPHCIVGTHGWKLYGETSLAMERNSNAIPLAKTTFGVSPKTMEHSLPMEAPETITIVGLVTNMCVISNVCTFQAKYPDAQIIVKRDLCASFSNELHDKTMDILEGLQVKVI